MAQTVSISAPKPSRLEQWFPYYFPVLLFLGMAVQTVQMAIFLCAVALALLVTKGARLNLGSRLCIPALAFFLFAMSQVAAALYAPVGTSAVNEFVKLLASFSLAVIFLTRCPRQRLSASLWGVGAVTAAISLLSVDAACDGLLWKAANAVLSKLGAVYTFDALMDIRINGLYNDANVTVGVFALGALLLFHQLDDHAGEGKKWLRPVGFILLGINTMGVLTSMSRGGIGCFCIACVAYLVFVGKGRRVALFLLMLEAAVCTLICGIVAFATLDGASMIPTLMTLVCGVPAWALDTFVGVRVARWLAPHGKAVAVSGIVVVAGIIVVCVAALNLTGPQTFDGGESITRAVELSSGDHTLTAEWTGEAPQVTVYTQSMLEGWSNTNTVRYEGSAEGCAFTIDEDLRTYFVFSAPEGTTLTSAAVDGTAHLPLDYTLLPEFIVTRLQDGLFSGYNFWQRTQYVQDGWTLFTQRPLQGFGLGSTGAWIASVQSFYYEVMYLHCHILQVMDDSGLLGTIPFLAFLLGAAWLALRRLKSDRRALAAMLLSCWVMMNLHGLMELTFSIRAYQCLAWVVLLSGVVAFGKPLFAKEEQLAGTVASVFLLAFLAFFGYAEVQHFMVANEREAFQTTSVEEYLDQLKSYASRELIDDEDLKLMFLAQAAVTEGLDSSYDADVVKYLDELRSSGTYSACTGLAQYYYAVKGQVGDTFKSIRQGMKQLRGNEEAWNVQFDFIRSDVLQQLPEEKLDRYLDGLKNLRADFEAAQEGRLAPMTLSEDNQRFFNAVDTVTADGMTGSAALTLLLAASGAAAVG